MNGKTCWFLLVLFSFLCLSVFVLFLYIIVFVYKIFFILGGFEKSYKKDFLKTFIQIEDCLQVITKIWVHLLSHLLSDSFTQISSRESISNLPNVEVSSNFPMEFWFYFIDPDPPAIVSITPFDGYSNIGLLVTWTPPEEPRGIISRYHVYYKELPWNTELIDRRNFCTDSKIYFLYG